MLYPDTSCLRSLSLLLILGLFLPACELVHDEPAFGEPGTVSVETGRVELSIINRTGEPVYVFIVGREVSYLIDWIPTVEGDGIPPKSTERRRYEDIDLLEGEREAIVYWWHAEVRDGRRTFGEVRSFDVRLPRL